MPKVSEKAITRAAIKHAALSELERLYSLLHTELEVSAHMSLEEIEAELLEMGLDPDQTLPLKMRQMISEETSEQQAPDKLSDIDERAYPADLLQGPPERPHHVYVSDEPLENECTDEVKLLILEIRCLAHQQRYEEALYIARETTRIAPDYWRAWTSLGTLFVLFGEVDEGEKIFDRVTRDFADHPKAVAAGLHGSAWVKEIQSGLNPSTDALREMARLYEKSLQFDDSRTNTRASLLINQMMTDEVSKHEKLLEDSVLHEGFFEALRFELNARSARMHKVMKVLPMWLRHLFYPIRPLHVGG